MFAITQAVCKVSSSEVQQPRCIKPASLFLDIAIATGVVAIAALAMYSAAGGNLGMLNFLSGLSPTTAGVMVIASSALLGTDNVAFACVLLFSTVEKESHSSVVKNKNLPPSTQRTQRYDEKQSDSFFLPPLTQTHLLSPPTSPYSTPRRFRVSLRTVDTPIQKRLRQIDEGNDQLKPGSQCPSLFPLLSPDQVKLLKERMQNPYTRLMIEMDLSYVQSFLEKKLPDSAPASNQHQNLIVKGLSTDDSQGEIDESDIDDEYLGNDSIFNRFIDNILNYVIDPETHSCSTPRIRETLNYLTETVVPILEQAKNAAAQAARAREEEARTHSKRVTEDALVNQKEKSRKSFKEALSYFHSGELYDISTLDITVIENSITKKIILEKDLNCKLDEITKLIAEIRAQKGSYEKGEKLNMVSFEKSCTRLKDILDLWKNTPTFQKQVPLSSCLHQHCGD